MTVYNLGAWRGCAYVLSHTGCPRRNVPDFGRVFLMLKYTDIPMSKVERLRR